MNAVPGTLTPRILPDARVSRILVIDDNPAIHLDFRKIFGASKARPRATAAEAALFGDQAEAEDAADFRLDSALQGEEGLGLVRQALEDASPYAVAFVDVRMPPGWDGIETTSRIWQADPDIQVVICTAYSDYSWSEMLAKLGRSDRLVILKKPFDTIEVMQLASALTEKWRLARQSRSILEGLECRVAERTRELAQAGDQLRASEAQYRLLFDGNPHPMWVYDLETLRFALVNDAAVERYGYTQQQFLEMTVRELRLPEDVAALETQVAELRGRGKYFGEWRHRRRDGSILDVEISSDRMVYDGRPARLVMAHDVTQRKKAEHRITRLNRVYAVLSGINTLIVRAADRDELFREACRIAIEEGKFRMVWIGLVDHDSGLIQPIASGGDVRDYFESTDLSVADVPSEEQGLAVRAFRGMKALVSNDVTQDPRIVRKLKLGKRGIQSAAVFPLIVEGRARGVLAFYSPEKGFFDDEEIRLLQELAGDIAFGMDHLDKQERLNYLANYDVLTGLANRSQFLGRVAQRMQVAAGAGRKLAVCLFDLERFKNINDTLGQPAGDALLRQVSAWLTQLTRDDARVARVGADQFAVLIPEVEHEEDVARTLEKMLDEFVVHPFHLKDGIFRVAAKVGVSLYPEDGLDADLLVKNAEAALKKAKASGDRYLFYTQKMTDMVAGRLSLENQLRHALENEEFVLHYQPKVSLATRKVTGAEALIRWNDPRTGLVPPGKFIPVLEETGLIYEVGRWALRRAIADYLAWRAAGLTALRIAVNVSPLQLRNRAFIGEIAQTIGIDPHAAAGLELEITESVIMEDARHSIATLQAIREMGVTLAIDDFGTGFSSLSYLAKLPVDTLKIDRSFVVEMTESPEGLALVSTIINLAHSLKLKVVAEGVETEEQSRLLRLLDCGEMQGFLFSKAVPVESFQAKFLLPA